jgi:hypothetical protein
VSRRLCVIFDSFRGSLFIAPAAPDACSGFDSAMRVE